MLDGLKLIKNGMINIHLLMNDLKSREEEINGNKQ